MSEIRFIRQPKVYLVGRQIVDEAALERFLSLEGVTFWETDTDVAGEKLSEVAGRLCYMSFSKPRPGGNKAYIDHILESGHGSVLEHAVFNLIISGVSRSFTHELIRHRAGFGYSQLSQRFVDESQCSFVLPPLYEIMVEADRVVKEIESFNDHCLSQQDWDSIKPYPPNLLNLSACYHRWLKFMAYARETYADQVALLMEYHPHLLAIDDRTARRKAARQAARSVLPNATETKIFVTANARAIRTFAEQRAALTADAEMRRVAVEIVKLMKRELPSMFGDFEILTTPEGEEYATPKYHKV